MRYRIGILACLVVLGACGGGDLPADSLGVAAESRLSANAWVVSSRASAAMPSAVDATLLRSADIAMANGFGYFVIVDRHSLKGDTTSFAARQFVFREPGTSDTIVAFYELTPELSGDMYDAQFTHDRLIPK